MLPPKSLNTGMYTGPVGTTTKLRLQVFKTAPHSRGCFVSGG
jgi:hypothetical protein